MLYAIAAICVSLIVIVLIGKPIRIEITYAAPEAKVPEGKTLDSPDPAKDIPAALQAMAYVNGVFHNVEEDTQNGKASN